MPPSPFKDLFSKQSADYARFRPTYPDSLFEYLATLVKNHETAWDCGTGNGQAALQLAKHFKQVIATDPSQKQLASAPKNRRIQYLKASSEKTRLKNAEVDLLTVAQAFHWFDQKLFFAEAKRVLKPEGILAFWCYELCEITPGIDAVVQKLYADVLGKYWEKERRLVEDLYRSVKMPFKEIKPPRFEMRARWSFEHLIGYLGTWSALQAYVRKNGDNPIEALYPELKKAWGKAKTKKVRWKIGLRVGKTISNPI